MFEEIIIMIGFAFFSCAISYILLRYTPDPLNKIIKLLAIIGIIIHELCHILMCLITNARIEKIRILGRNENAQNKGEFNYFGNVKLEKRRKLTFLQALLIGLAPLIFSFWLFFFLWGQILNPKINVLLFFSISFLWLQLY